jgi:hypothetical protein
MRGVQENTGALQMATTKTERSSERPEHQVIRPDHPTGWARRFELYLDKESRRLLFYGALFGAFALVVVISLVIALIW